MPDNDFRPLRPPRLSWEGETPLATDFDDSYFSRDNGAAETEHVFLRGNQLQTRFQQLLPGSHFVIGETGFGTGLNFLSAAAHFLQHAPADSRLHFVSAELHPLSADELARACHHWPHLAELAAELCQHYPAPGPGFHRRTLAGGRICLTLMYGDAGAMFQEFNGRIDAWFLDGFAPARNQNMWQQSLFDRLAELSQPGATLATFTAAGFVRRGLQQAGFSIQRVPGYGRKREMLTGQRDGSWQPVNPPRQNILVVGAGLAGATCARALAERGHRVQVLDPLGVAGAASGNLAGVVYTSASAHPTAQNRFYQSSYLQALHWLARHGFPGRESDGRLNGVLQLPATERHRDKALVALDSGLWPSGILLPGPASPAGSLLFTGGGYLRPVHWCQYLLSHPNISFQPLPAERIQPDDGRWQVQAGTESFRADKVVLANAAASLAQPGLDWLPLKSIRGQVSYCRSTPASQQWSRAICHSGYLTPAIEGQHCVGATFDLRDNSQGVRAEDNQRNLAELRQQLPQKWQELGGENIEVTGERVGFRCQSKDFLPLVGPACDAEGAPIEGLYLNIAHGSRGITGTPLCAELIASLVNDEPLPLDRTMFAALEPKRFILRHTRKGTGKDLHSKMPDNKKP